MLTFSAPVPPPPLNTPLHSTGEAPWQPNAASQKREERRRQRAATPPRVPGYRLLRIIGIGGYGEVWLSQAKTGEYCAIKVVWREDFNHAELYAQERNGTLLYKPVSQGNYGLVPILQVGQEVAHGQKGQAGREYFYCVMKLADDAVSRTLTNPDTYCPRTLQNVMNRYGRRPMPLDVVLGVGIHLAYGLARLHEVGLTHGDIKPANIIYINEHPCFADAGTVGPVGKRQCSGTEGYIPPEGPGSRQADVYALALVLYEMATGCDRHDFPTLPAGLPEGNKRWLSFNRIICAAADPAPNRRRINSAAQLGRQLEALRHPPVFLKTKRPWKFQPLFALLGVAGVLIAMVLTVLALSHLPDDFMKRLPHAWEVLRGTRPTP